MGQTLDDSKAARAHELHGVMSMVESFLTVACAACGLGATSIATRAPLSSLSQSSFFTSTVESLNIMYPACESASPIVPSIIMLSRSGGTRPRPKIRISGSIGA